MLKHNKFKPPSLELKEDVELEESSLHAMLRARAAAARGAVATLPASACSETAAALTVRIPDTTVRSERKLVSRCRTL
jgi:hypothetical protein